MKNTFRDIPLSALLASAGLLLLSLLVASCGRSTSGFVEKGGSIFAGGKPVEDEGQGERERDPEGEAAGQEGPADSAGSVDPVDPDSDDESLLRYGRPSDESPSDLRPSDERPSGPFRTRQTSPSDSLSRTEVLDPEGQYPRDLIWPEDLPDSLLADVIPDSLIPAEGGIATDSLLAALPDSVRASLSDSLLQSLPDTLFVGEVADSLEPPPSRAYTSSPWGASGIVSSFSLSDLPPPSDSTSAEFRGGSSFQIFGRRESSRPVGDALLYEVGDRWLSRSTLRESAVLSPRQQSQIDTVLFRPVDGFGPRFRSQDFVAHQVAPNIEDETLEFSHLHGGEGAVEPKIRMSMREYTRRLTQETTYDLWTDSFREDLKRTDRESRQDRLVNLDIPLELPGGLQSIFGKGKPSLSVAGNEQISFRGRSQWRPNLQANDVVGRQSKFPQLNMEQRLNLNLTGTIGDKVTVDVDQSSESDTPLANLIKIRYTGYEDEIIQRVDLGNTNLRLPGTRYVTFSENVQGLFGINALAKVGDIDFNMILSKQEGRNDSKSITSQAEVRTITIDDYNFVSSQYFFLRDPDGCPWQLGEDALEVYIDDGNQRNNVEDGTIVAIATIDGEPAEGEGAYTGDFRYLETSEYQVQTDLYTGHPVLVLNRSLGERDVLAVAYQGFELGADLLEFGAPIRVGTGGGAATPYLKMIRQARSDQSVNRADLTEGVWGPTANLELRNIYRLGASNILAEGFEMKVRLKATIGSDAQPDRLANDTTFLQQLGLDLSERTESGNFIPGSDQRVEPQWLNLTEGLLYLPDLRPFDPSPTDLAEEAADCAGFSYYRFNPSLDRQKEDRPSWAALDSTFRAPDIYDRDIFTNVEDFSRYFLEVTYRSPVSNIRLDAFNILEGSEVVTANGRRLQRDRDYRIDYDSGVIDILPAAGITETDAIDVSYSHVPFGGGGGQKTLAGIAAFVRPDNAKWNFSSTWLFESKGGAPGNEGRRPRLGEEPSRTLVGEFAGQYQTDSWLITDVMDKIPFMDAREQSRLELEGGLGISIPNPNTRNQLYVDDFEGAKDVLSLSLNRRAWRMPSIPLRIKQEETTDSLATARRGELLWYTPRRALQEYDLKPTLEEREGDDNRQMLEVFFAPKGQTDEERRQSWIGLTQPLSASGINLSSAQFLDIWINDGVPYQDRSEREGKLYIELGFISEDAAWTRNDVFADQSTWRVVPPNGELDTEDRSEIGEGDGTLDLSDEYNEDIGLDFVENGQPGDDPFDNYAFEDSDAFNDGEYQPIQFRQINGTEGNQLLDTEDFDGGGRVDDVSNYFEIELDLADETLWETDVRRDFVLECAPCEGLSQTPADSSGWRRIRVSLANEELVQILKSGSVDPDWERIFHARMWFTGFSDAFERIQIGGIEIIGNRWLENPITNLQDEPLDPAELSPGEDFFVGVRNNKDDTAVYDPPFDPGERTDDNTEEREQSIALELRNFQPGHRASAYRTYTRAQNFATLYEEMQFFINSQIVSGEADLLFSVRLSRDANSETTNYYEYTMPVPDRWRLATVDLAALSQLQLEEPDSLSGVVAQSLGDGVSISRKGQPSLNDIKRITFSVENVGRTPLREGSVWVNELRLNGVKKDRGLASRAEMNVTLSDFGSVNMNLDRTGADFLRIGSERGSGTTKTSFNSSGRFNLEKFVEGRGLILPLNVSVRRDKSVPKFQTNSDLVLETATDRDISESSEENYRFSYSKRQSENPWMKYMVDPFSMSAEYSHSIDRSPTVRDTTVRRSGSVRWSLGLQDAGKVRIGNGPLGLFKNSELNFLPTQLGWNLSAARTDKERYTRSNLASEYSRVAGTDSKSATLGLNAKAQPIRSVTYDISSGRDLNLKENQTRVGGLGLGRERSRAQNLSANYEIPIMRRLLGPRVNWNSGSNLSFANNYSGDLDEPDRSNSYSNNNTTSVSGRIDPKEVANFFKDLPFFGGEEDSSATPTRSRRPGAQRFSIDPISASYSISNSSSYPQRKGEPDLVYQLGLDTVLGGDTRSLRGASSSTSEGQNWRFDTNIRLPLRASVKTSYSSRETKGLSNGQTTTTYERTWPDLDITWGDVHKKLGLERLLKLKSFTAKTRYSRRRNEGANDLRVTTDLSPLLDIRATLENGMQATLNSSSSTTVTDRFFPSRSTQTNSNKRAGLTVKKTINLRKRVKIPGSSQSRMVTTRMDITGGADWSATKQETVQAGGRGQVASDNVRVSFNGSTNYGFTERINGVARVEFGQDKDRKNNANTQRFIEISVSASFNF